MEKEQAKSKQVNRVEKQNNKTKSDDTGMTCKILRRLNRSIANGRRYDCWGANCKGNMRTSDKGQPRVPEIRLINKILRLEILLQTEDYLHYLGNLSRGHHEIA